jgi:6-phosphogluconolactonase
MRHLTSFLLGALCLTSVTLSGAEPVVFISAFASGGKAGIHAFRFDSQTGALQPLHRTTDIQNPFFLAISPYQRFLYAINAAKFGGPENAFVRPIRLKAAPAS